MKLSIVIKLKSRKSNLKISSNAHTKKWSAVYIDDHITKNIPDLARKQENINEKDLLSSTWTKVIIEAKERTPEQCNMIAIVMAVALFSVV